MLLMSSVLFLGFIFDSYVTALGGFDINCESLFFLLVLVSSDGILESFLSVVNALVWFEFF